MIRGDDKMTKFAGFSCSQRVRPTFAAHRPSAVFYHHHHQNDDGGDDDDCGDDSIHFYPHAPCGDHI